MTHIQPTKLKNKASYKKDFKTTNNETKIFA